MEHVVAYELVIKGVHEDTFLFIMANFPEQRFFTAFLLTFDFKSQKLSNVSRFRHLFLPYDANSRYLLYF